MAEEVDPINARTLGLQEIEDRLDNPKLAMEAIGHILIAAAQKAFEDQKFGSFKWPPQYEGGTAPWIHIAGVASDLSKGESVKSTRFAPVDALKDSQDLWRSIDVRTVARGEVTVGSSVPYAKFHQWGKTAVQPVTGRMKEGLANAWRDADGDNKKALGKMWHWFRKDAITTRIRQRPFLGITDEIEDDIRRTVEMFVDEGRIA